MDRYEDERITLLPETVRTMNKVVRALVLTRLYKANAPGRQFKLDGHYIDVGTLPLRRRARR